MRTVALPGFTSFYAAVHVMHMYNYSIKMCCVSARGTLQSGSGFSRKCMLSVNLETGIPIQDTVYEIIFCTELRLRVLL